MTYDTEFERVWHNLPKRDIVLRGPWVPVTEEMLREVEDMRRTREELRRRGGL